MHLCLLPPQGDVGFQGQPGPPGPQGLGEPGPPVTHTKLLINVFLEVVSLFIPWSFSSFRSSQGPQGPQGVTGERGPAGEGLPGPKVSRRL